MTTPLLEIRDLHVRIEEREILKGVNLTLPRGADPATHTKLGRGGLADVEWTVQLLQLRYGATGRPEHLYRWKGQYS